MLRVAVCQFGAETNCFSKGRSSLADLCPPDGRWCLGTEVEEKNKGTKTYIGGALDALRELGAVAVPLDYPKMNGANFLAGSVLSAECLQDGVIRICDELRRRKGEYDCLFLAMHGAAVSDLTEDVETYVLTEVRKVVGSMKIVSSLDNHGNLTPEMLRLSDGFIGTKTVPHFDIYDAGYRAASLLVHIMEGKVNPRMALCRVPILTTWLAGSTLQGASKEIMEYFGEYAKMHGLLDATFYHGFCSADCACSSASVLVMADGYTPEQEAKELAQFVWERREGFRGEAYTAEEAIDHALALVKDGYVVINEGSDNPGGGFPGDGTYLLRAMIGRNIPGCIMGPICDPEAARICHTHRMGDRFALKVGSLVQPELTGEPIDFDQVELLGLSDGKYVSTSPVNLGVTMDFGKTARLKAGNVEFIVVTERFQTFDDNAFLITGCDMRDYSVVGIKSANHFRAYFASRADAIVSADTGTIRTADIRDLNYQKLIRPIFPLDEDVEFNGDWPPAQ